jgi:cell division protein FtsZ
MAGSASEGQAATQRRMSPPVTQYDEDPAPAPSDDRIEIPAFLRRQAN